MHVRLVAVDLDGTLVRRDRTVSARSRAALAACAERGVPVVVVTARRWDAARTLLRDLVLHGHAVVGGGCAVRAVDTGRVVVSAVLRPGVVGVLVEHIAACGLQPLVAVDHGEHVLAGDPSADGPSARRWMTLRGRSPTRVGLETLGGVAAARVLAMGSASRVLAAHRRCAGLPCRIVVQPAIVPLDNRGERALEMYAAAADKGTALRDLCRSLGVLPGEAMAIGDAPSDLPMLEAAGVGVLMGQAEAGLHRPGMVVAPSVEEDGAAWAIERYVLGGTSPPGSLTRARARRTGR